MATRTTPRLDWALYLAGRGWPVFPLLPGSKQPALHGDTPDRPCPRTGRCVEAHQGWETLATTDTSVIQRHWSANPAHNIGLATGPAGLLVIDLDVASPGKQLPDDCRSAGAIHGAWMLARLAEADDATVGDTWTVSTPSGGTHLYFRQPTGVALRNTRGSDTAGLAGLIDTRGWGGYVVAPGSTTPQGAYELICDVDPPVLPGWLVYRLSVRRSTAVSAPRRIAAPHVSAYVAAAIQGETTRVATARSGQHNKAQMIAALALGQLVGGGHLDRDTALTKLLHAAASHVTGTCHCTEHGVRAVFEWGLTNGARNPRHINPGSAT
jgi:hypothetical protein